MNELPSWARIRPIVIGLFRHEGRILVAEGVDRVADETFYRPIGGAIEFGETSAEALVREVTEELGEEISDLEYLGTLENIFTCEGATGHEIVQVYDARFVDAAVYGRRTLHGHEADADDPDFRASWMFTRDFEGEDAHILYPDGLLDLLQSSPM